MGSIQKQRYIVDLALSSLLRRKGKNGALVVVYALVLFVLASVLFAAASLKREASLILQDAPEMTVQRLVAGRQDLVPISYSESIAQIRGVQSVEPRLWGYYFDALNGANYTIVVNPARDVREGDIVIGAGVARRAQAGGTTRLREKDIIPFKTHDGTVLPLTVSGLFPSASELVTADLITVSEHDFRRIFAIDEAYATDLVLRVRNPRELSTIAAKIIQLHPDTRPIQRDEILRTYDAVFDWRSGLITMVLGGALLAFFILAWDKATGLSAEEKREIGILKAVGWETGDILLMKFWEGAAISLTAFFLGIIFAYLHVFVASFVLFEPILKGWSVLYPGFRLTPSVSFYQLATLFFLTVIPYTVVTIIPSWRSATIDPDMVMRQ
ncbi:MAG: FtsX-like permease family protein [Desulfofustis sp.]|nr:FtsX-like permease family protein [Desulfofustis sp.]